MADTFTLPSLEPGATLLVKDTVHTSGKFLLLHILKQCFGKAKQLGDAQRFENQPSLTIVLALSETFDHYASMSKKLGLHLSSLRSQGQVAWIDLTRQSYQACYSQSSFSVARSSPAGAAPPSPAPVHPRTTTDHDNQATHHTSLQSSGDNICERTAAAHEASASGPREVPMHPRGQSTGSLTDLREVYRRVKDVVDKVAEQRDGINKDAPSKAGGGLLIVVDDVSLLEVASGGSVDSTLNFLHYCKTLRLDNQRCSLLLLSHLDVPTDDCPCFLTHALEYEAHASLEVRPLESGHATDVHGQVLLHERYGMSQANHSKEEHARLCGKDYCVACEQDRSSRSRKFIARYRIMETGVHFTSV